VVIGKRLGNSETGHQRVKPCAFASQTHECIGIPPIRSAISCATALHEVGHVLGRFQLSKSTLVRERAAWRWARRNALMWTPAVERCRLASRAWYEARVNRNARRRCRYYNDDDYRSAVLRRNLIWKRRRQAYKLMAQADRFAEAVRAGKFPGVMLD